jgi:hypothetical protein
MGLCAPWEVTEFFWKVGKRKLEEKAEIRL